MLTGLIGYILQKNDYTQSILDNEIYSNYKYLDSNVTKWIRPLLLDVINKVYEDIEKTESITAEKFFKRPGRFEKLITKIDDLRFDRDDWSLKEKFKLN